MTVWLRALVDPRPIARLRTLERDRAIPHSALLAMLSLGSLTAYADAARRSNAPVPSWLAPARTKRDDDSASPGQPDSSIFTLLTGALQLASGQGKAHETLAQLLDKDVLVDDELIACATCLSALSMTRDGSFGVATELLESKLDQLSDPYCSAYISLQLANSIERWDAELSDRVRTLRSSVANREFPSDVERPAGGVDLGRLFTAVARRNISEGEQRSGTWILVESDENFEARRLLNEQESPVLADLASNLLDESFSSATTRPAVTTRRFGFSGDKTVEQLERALLRAQLLGDVEAEYQTLRLLARTRIVSTFGTNNSDPATSALTSLVELADRKAVERSSMLLYSAGPYQALRRATDGLLGERTNHLDRYLDFDSSCVALFRTASDVLDKSQVDFLLTSALAAIRGKRGASDKMELTRLATRLVERASLEAQADCIDLVLTGSPDVDDTFIAGLAQAIPWETVESTKRSEALEWARSSTAQSRERVMLAVLDHAGPVAPSDSIEQVRHRCETSKDFAWVAAFWNLGEPGGLLEPADYAMIIDRAAAELERIRYDAARGSFSVSAGAQPSSILARVALFAGQEAAWRPLLDFLLDRNVSVDDKSPAIEAITGLVDRVPEWVVALLHTSISETSGNRLFGTDRSSLFNQRGGIAGTGLSSNEQLALAIQVGAVDPGDALSVVSQLAGSESTGDRTSAAELIRLLRRMHLSEQLIPLGITLMNDGSPYVRAAATLSLSQISGVGEWLLPTLRRSLISAAQDPGVLVPLRLLQGLYEEPTGDPILLEEVRRLREHGSHHVRTFAERVLSRDE